MADTQGWRSADGRRAPNGVAAGGICYSLTVAGEVFVRFLDRPGDWEAMRDAGTPYHLVIDDVTGMPAWATMAAGGGGSYTDEQAQDSVGLILTDTSDIDFTYDDATPLITALVKARAVTFAKMQAIAEARLLGRTTAGSGDVEEISVGTGLTLADGVLSLTGGVAARTSTTIVTAVLAASAQETGSFTLSKASVLVRAVADFGRQARIRLYGRSSARDNDVARGRGTSAVSGSGSGTGLLADLVFSSENSYAIDLTPVVMLANPGNPSTTTIYCTIDNLTTGSVPVSVTLYHTPVEA